MTGFFWASGHLGWGLFATFVFSASWVLAADLVWRLTRTTARKLAVTVCGGWLAGEALIVLIYAAAVL